MVDDHPLLCDALDLALQLFDGFIEVRAADSLSSAITLLDAHVLPGLTLPDVSGLDGLITHKHSARAIFQIEYGRTHTPPGFVLGADF